jgi:hypothetical protein
MLLSLSEQLLAAGFRVRFRAAGASMRPTILDGDILTVDRVDSEMIVPGDIVLYRRFDRPIAHRVAEIRTRGGASVVIARGDGQGSCDAPVDGRQILGRVVSIERAPARAARRSPLGDVRTAVAHMSRPRCAARPQPAVVACLTAATTTAEARVVSGTYAGTGVDKQGDHADRLSARPHHQG